MSKLREQFITTMKLRRLSAATQSQYIRCLVELNKHFNKRLDLLEDQDLSSYILYLSEENKLSYSSINVFISSSKLFYHETLGRRETLLRHVSSKTPVRLPHSLSHEELKQLFASISNLKHRMLMMLTYSSGLRIQEALDLHVSDIQSKQMRIHVRSGKRDKERYTILSHYLLPELRAYYRLTHPKTHLFPSSRTDLPLTQMSAYQIFKRAALKVGLKQPGGTHLLRHSFATHLLEQGVDVMQLKRLMGHSSLQTTANYLHLTSHQLKQFVSPLDLIFEKKETK